MIYYQDVTYRDKSVEHNVHIEIHAPPNSFPSFILTVETVVFWHYTKWPRQQSNWIAKDNVYHAQDDGYEGVFIFIFIFLVSF